MSSQAAEEQGSNAVMCYFPWLPYYLRYQIGFDIIVNPSDAQADPSVAGQSQRLIHVELYFPDGFICNPASFSGMPGHPSSSHGAPHFLPPHPHFHPPLHPACPHTTPYFQHPIPTDFQGSMMWQEQRDARLNVYVENGELGEYMVIDDTPYDIIRQCKQCNEFHREPDHIHKKQPQGVLKCNPSKQLQKQSRRSRQRPSTSRKGGSRQHPPTSGTTGQSDISHAAPDTASQIFIEHPRGYIPVTVRHPYHFPIQGWEVLSTQQAAELYEEVMKHNNDEVASLGSQLTAATISEERQDGRMDVGGHSNDGEPAESDKKHSAKPRADSDSQTD